MVSCLCVVWFILWRGFGILLCRDVENLGVYCFVWQLPYNTHHSNLFFFHTAKTHPINISRVKCSVCGNSWYQSRDRLFDIPNDSHDLLPAEKSDLDRIALNLSKDLPAGWMGDYKLYVGNLDFRTTAAELRTFFDYNAKKEGSVCDVSIVKGADGRSRGFAFVTFYDAEDGKVALENGNGMEFNGRELAVREPNN